MNNNNIQQYLECLRSPGYKKKIFFFITISIFIQHFTEYLRDFHGLTNASNKVFSYVYVLNIIMYVRCNGYIV